MALLEPFVGEIVRQDWAREVVAPSVDALDAEAREQLAQAHPYNFLHVTRAPTSGEATDTVLANSVVELARLREAGVFEPAADGQHAVHIYRLTDGDHHQTGVVAELPVSAAASSLLPHENTRQEQVNLLLNTLEEVKRVSSPVALTARANDAWRSAVDKATEAEPGLDFQAIDGIRQQIWTLPGSDAQHLADVVGGGPFYIVDGHHRVEAATQHWRRRGTTQPGPHQRLLVAVFATAELLIGSFNRLVHVDRTADEVRDVLAAAGSLELADRPVEPSTAGTIGVYLERQWYQLSPSLADDTATPGEAPITDPVASLDVAVLHGRLLTELGIVNARTDERVDYQPAESGAAELMSRCDLDGGVGFTLAPVSVDDLMAVADARRVMPPKSTYFHPKVRSGVFLVDG